MTTKTIRELALELTVETVKMCDNINGRHIYVNQLLRCCASIGANSYEAKYAQSDADFINKYEIALKESYETQYWYDVLHEIGEVDDIKYKDLSTKCGIIRKKIIASVSTVKNRNTNL